MTLDDVCRNTKYLLCSLKTVRAREFFKASMSSKVLVKIVKPHRMNHKLVPRKIFNCAMMNVKY